MRTALLFHIQVRSREDILRSLDDLDDVSRQVLVAVLQSKDEIVRQQQASEALAMKRHEQLVNTVSNYRSLPISQDDVLDEIKARLHDQIQDDRFEDIAEAHQSTFQWILKHDNNTQSTWPNLYHWLQNDQGLYWISGKSWIWKVYADEVPTTGTQTPGSTPRVGRRQEAPYPLVLLLECWLGPSKNARRALSVLAIPSA
jgi:hypothetical protein